MLAEVWMFRSVIPPSMPAISAASAWLNPPCMVTKAGL
jgi:hypothetical protein